MILLLTLIYTVTSLAMLVGMFWIYLREREDRRRLACDETRLDQDEEIIGKKIVFRGVHPSVTVYGDGDPVQIMDKLFRDYVRTRADYGRGID